MLMHYDRDRSLHDMVRQQALAAPHTTAVVFDDRSITYGELDRISDGLAVYLAALGVAKGDAVGLFLPRSLGTIVAQLAILKAGGAYVPLDPALPGEHIEYVLGECRPKVIFADASCHEKILAVAHRTTAILDLDEAFSAAARTPAGERPTIKVTGADMAYVMYTSGSTGRPKGVSIPHRAISRVVLDQNYIEFAPGDVVLHAATIAFDASTLEIWGALLNGCVLAGMADEKFSLSRLCDVIRDNGVTIAWLTTGLFNLFADYATGDLPTLKHMVFGGEVGSAEHARRFLKAHPGCRITNGYGPTETTVFATAFSVPVDFSEPELPIGKAISHTAVHIVDDSLRIVPQGVEGQLAVSGDGLAIGYLNRPDLTDEKFVVIATERGPLRCYLTGDVAALQADGTVTFKGRVDRQVKIDGKRIELDEIEAALRRDPRLWDGIVMCHKQGPTGKRIVAYLRPRRKGAGSDPDFVQQVMATLRSTLPAYMIPSCALVLDEFPLNQNGKIERAKLPLPAEPAAPDAMSSEPASQTEAILIELWQSVLGLSAIGLDRNFFDLGGTSLQLMRVHAGVEAKLGRPIDVVVLFSHPTIRELARFLDGKTAGPIKFMTPAQRAAMQRQNRSQLYRSPL